MNRCLQLAVMGLGSVAPNPMVGSVITYKGRIIGEGYHKQFGGPHAEVNAVNSIQHSDIPLLSESTLYVNLEPCSHYGKTPPCADMIISKHISKVVIASSDPNPLVAGNGIQKLKEAGVEVVTGVLQAESDFLNRRFITFHTKQRPYIILKWAQSSDEYMASKKPEKIWLTGEASKQLVHQWRSEEPGILVGKRTVLIDDPELTVRLVKGKNPVRIIIDPDLSLSNKRKVFKPGTKTIVFNKKSSSNNGDTELVKVDFTDHVIPHILAYLYAKGIQSIIVEGGAYTLQQFILSDLWDEARIFTAPVMLHDGLNAPTVAGKEISNLSIGHDNLKVVLNSAN